MNNSLYVCILKIVIEGTSTQCCSGWRGIFFDPEGHPGEDNGEDAGDVSLDGEVAHSPTEVKVDRHHHIITWAKWKWTQFALK